jgi:hypothetical protein
MAVIPPFHPPSRTKKSVSNWQRNSQTLCVRGDSDSTHCVASREFSIITLQYTQNDVYHTVFSTL